MIAQFDLLGQYVPGLQANFIFGSDSEEGSDSLTLTKEFILRTPNVFPTVNIPTPYAGTPLYEQMRREGRILEATPFAFYYNPYLAITLKHYDPLTYYEKLIEMHEDMTSAGMMLRRLATGKSRTVRAAHALRSLYTCLFLRDLRQIRKMLATDRRSAPITRDAPPICRRFTTGSSSDASAVTPNWCRPRCAGQCWIPQRPPRPRGPGRQRSESESPCLETASGEPPP